MTEIVYPVVPADAGEALLIGRVWDPLTSGPRVVAVQGDGVYDLSELCGTVSELLERNSLREDILEALLVPRWELDDIIQASLAQDTAEPHLLAPVDLQVIKACGVTFVDSMIERVIEERTGGDPALAAQARDLVSDALGDNIASVRPGSPEAARAKAVLQEQGLWSQYLEVGIGPDPEVFTKAPVMSSVGIGAGIGVARSSLWNNPEPELVLIVNSANQIVGATLGNDVNLRDVEGRSALLLGKAKDNNASSSLGPFIRLFDDNFSLETLRSEEILLHVAGKDGFTLEGRNSLARISRPFEELVAATSGDHHQYPDGFALYTGTLFAPTTDRDDAGQGFTHKRGDVVSIHSPHLGTLVNTVAAAEELPRWTFGVGELFRYLTAQNRAASQH
ncbi:fumarylacetoacetate hydrolase family protein [Paenarthrobacter sp. AB444]|uniref:fumarylacetoacetate hydrolase family protein n=1 Tax=Paenarthrobacter sp. AB444 TaxID=3025681 RepID=UPI0023671DA9|nr:fumarylacetoacetate hydrolase family protein [Paenarthrobacter sp. AB444]MDD7833887.1 fumarylacetoacetate hydrolase family protein [Paenarthrobacter sp. AB444]